MSKTKRKPSLTMTLFGFVGLLSSSLAGASDFQSPRTMALGGAGHAGPLLNDPIYLNPSFVSFNRTYGLGFSYLKYSDASYKGRNLNLSVLDGRFDLFQAGLAYTVREEGALVNLALSRLIIERLAVGVGTKFFFNRNHTTSRDLMISSAGAPVDWMQLALILDNVIENAEAKRNGFRRELTLGTKFNIMGVVLAYVDPHLTPSITDSTRFGHEVGLEFTLMNDLFLRLGTFRNASLSHQGGLRGTGVGGGLGVVGPRISIDYGYSRVTQSPAISHRVTTHNLGFTVFF